jgi:capsule polysaccharide export protein KpsE/RkpR
MPKTDVDRQRDYRRHQAERLAALMAEHQSLRSELSVLRDQLSATLAEADRLAGLACKHSAAVVEGGTCPACGAEIWCAREGGRAAAS